MFLSEQVNKTYRYGQIFGSDLNLKDLLLWFASGRTINISQIPQSLVKKLTPSQKINRQKKIKISKAKCLIGRKSLSLLKKIPFILFVGITGSVAANNAKIEDDIDVMIITSPNTLWIVRPFVLFMLQVAGVRRTRFSVKNKVQNLICPNLWLDSNNLKIANKSQSFYTAHEVLQVKPILNRLNIFENFIYQNRWVKKYLANAYYAKKISKPKKLVFSFVYSLIKPLNFIFFTIQMAMVSVKKDVGEISQGKAFFHNPSFHPEVLKKLKN